MNSRPDEFTPYWLQTAMPSTGNGEMPGQPVMFPWEYPWPHTAPQDNVARVGSVRIVCAASGACVGTT